MQGQRHDAACGLRPYTFCMTYADVSAFVARLETGRVAPAEFKSLTASDWQAVRGFLEARRRDHLQSYINALFLLRMKADPAWAAAERIYSEAEILAEFAPRDPSC